MFKLESYITPILLSYVDKYIKNFRPEDSQVSLWGGDAVFHNLDLRLEVLEQELQLPFSFVRGHIHELQIHVPWTKLASEPITITINTIECILKLRGGDSPGSDSASHTSASTNVTREKIRRASKRQDVVAPSGYVQSLVNKIVSNITIFCNNLILKYVEEDIVLSVNVKTVTLQSANELWLPTFSEISPLLRKLVTLADLTICLDKRNASGKIEMYQEPLLYRCSVELHLLRSYHSATAKRASVTRVDIHCARMDFSLTEQQVPMLMRLALLALALHGKELRPEQSADPEVDPLEDDDDVAIVPEEGDESNESWAGWAWSFVPSILPYYFEEDWADDQQIAYAGHTYHTGFYIEQASVSLKVTESAPDRSYCGPRKVKFIPFLVMHLQGCFMDIILRGAGWLNVQLGVSRATVDPYGDCFCGIQDSSSGSEEKKDNQQDIVYFTAGIEQKNYIVDSLFDPESRENRGLRKTYNASWDYHLRSVTEALLLEKTPAVAVDYLYMLELPEDFSSERLSELGSDLEYSNLAEKSLCRVVVGPTAVKVCSGLLHRLQMVHHYSKVYDYSPYSTPKPEPTREQLLPVSTEDFESLDQNIPKQVFQVTLFKPVIHIILTDHPVFDPVSWQAPRMRRKKQGRVQPPSRQMIHLPRVTLECQCLDARVVKPMYPRRLITTTCQLPAPPQHMFHACHFHTNVKLLKVSSQLVLSPGNQTTFLMPSNLAYTRQTLLLPQYWNNPDIPYIDQSLTAESLTVTCTKAKLMVIANIIQSQYNPTSAIEWNSTLLSDAAKHAGVEYLELCVEEMSYHRVITPGTEAFSLILGSVKAFVQEFPLSHGVSEPEQALVLSGPDNSATGEIAQQPLLSLTLQYTRDPKTQDHPPVLIFNLREVRACVDPMMWQWLRYAPTRNPIRHDADIVTSSGSTAYRRMRRLSSETSVGMEPNLTRRAPTPQESVHSSSDREPLMAQTGPSLSPVANSRGTRSESGRQVSVTALPEPEAKWSRSKLLYWFPVWRGLVLSGDMAQCVVYLPTSSLSAVGAQSIEDALAQCMPSTTEVLVITFPYLTFRSAARKQHYSTQLPVKLPESVWTKNKVSFPWSFSVSDMSCYTLQHGTKLHFLKPVSATATVGISTKYQNDDVTLASLGLCVHVDTTPIKISVSQEQVILMANVLVGLLEFSSSLQYFNFSYADTGATPLPDPPIPASPIVFPESSGSTPLETEESNEHQSEISQHSDAMKMNVLMQSTLARLTISLYAGNTSPAKEELKLVIDMEDIMTSLDLQQIYLKIKCKVAFANILHYVRKTKGSEWSLGPHVGLVMRGHEDVATPHSVHREADDGSGFLSLTFTRAKCRNVHSRWGTRKQTTLLSNPRNSDPNSTGGQADNASARYISEIMVKLQALDFVFSAVTLSNFVAVLYPILMLPERKETYTTKSSRPPINWMMQINNNTLPLLYLDTHSIRIILPAAELTKMGELHDVCLIQVEAITLTPQADNPLGRVVVRNDIYHMAEQTRILCIPGSEVEDRQYQLDITGLNINTGTWKELDRCLSLSSAQKSGLHTMSENPALEWNNLVSGKESITPHMQLLPVMTRLNLCIVAAPAIVYRGNILVCGHSLEVNAVTDIEVSVTTGQLFLASALATEVFSLFNPLLAVTESRSQATFTEILPMQSNKSVSVTSFEMEGTVIDHNRFADSGVDCADASSASLLGGLGFLPGKASSSPSQQKVPDSPAVETGSKCKPGGVWHSTERRETVPVEILLTAGKVSFALFEVMEGPNSELQFLSSRLKQKHTSHVHSKDDSMDDVGYEAGSEEGSLEEVLPFKKNVQPLLYVLLTQPHAFFSKLPFVHKIQLSCFDFSIWTSEPGFLIPQIKSRPEDFTQIFLETKNGDSHPDTGIAPAFLTAKWSQSIGKASVIDVEVGRPTKLHGSLSQWYFIEAIIDKVLNIFNAFTTDHHHSPISELYASEDETLLSSNCETEQPNMEKQKWDAFSLIGEVAAISVTTQQLVFQVTGSSHGAEVVASVAGLKGTTTRVARGQVDRLAGSLNINCLLVTTSYNKVSRPLLNPWSCTLEVGLAWEPWLMANSPPQVQLTAESDCILLDVGPEHIHTLQLIWAEYEPLLNALYSRSKKESMCISSPPVDQDQHYRDDLRAGAFQFVDASTGSSREDLPLPYQVMFWQAPPTMAWRYPQPRALTRVDVFPVPFKVATEHQLGREPKGQVLCSLQYWSECHARYKPYAQFHLSESEMCRLKLPSPPHQAVACTWRVQLILHSEVDENDDDDETSEDSSHIVVSPRALAACMRVDSFFSPHQVPCFQAALNISSIQVAMYNHMTRLGRPLPSNLKQFSLDQLTPETQFFMSFALDNSTLYMCTWASGDICMVEFSSLIRCDVVDYAYLTQQCAIEPFQAKAQLTLGDKRSLKLVTRPISVRYGPATCHTLTVSSELWAQAFRSFEDERAVPSDDYQVIVSRYVICNDLTRPLRFGQASTDEDILLGSRECHLYSWRSQRAKLMLRVGVEEGAWIWSKPFSIDTDGLQLCKLADCGMQNISILVKVTSLSLTQKQVILSGQLVITNLLAEHLECVAVGTVDDSARPKSDGQNLFALGKSTPPSVLLDANCKMTLRIRFHRFQGVSTVWSGDIPLRENTKTGQPWLVKVPLQDKGQFLSVWCHVIRQQVGHGMKILAMLCPLYMIRSHLPIHAKVLIDTPGLKVHLQSTVNGRGEDQQLYCPGTVDHSHKLTFQLEGGVPPSNPCVPLSYAMIDQRDFFSKMNEKDVDVDKILTTVNEPPELQWPFIGEEYANIAWVPAEQPETHVTVKYGQQSPYCSTLLVELQPWALLVNLLGCSVALMVEECIVCWISNKSVVTPPKLENTFNLALDIKGIIHMSPPLQLSRLDWGSSFYMPRISGLIPNSGNIQTVLQCGRTAGILNIASNIVKEMRIITLRANYVICNKTSQTLKLSAIAIREYEKSTDFLAEENHKCVHTILPAYDVNNSFGIPIVQWNILGDVEAEGEFVLYIMLNMGSGWSSPLRVSDGIIRRSFSVPIAQDRSGLCNSPYTLTAQERSGQMFLAVHPENHPQIIIHNMCRFKILCAQGILENDGSAVEENPNLMWWCCVNPHSSSHYSLPAISEKFPDLLSSGSWPPLVLTLADKQNEHSNKLVWSQGITIIETQEQFVRLPGHGDVKVKIEMQCHTTHITVDTVSHVEISARDIRTRLIRLQKESKSNTVEKIYNRPLSAHSAPDRSHQSSYSSGYLSASCSSQSQVELHPKTNESETSFMSTSDSVNTAPPECSVSKESCATLSSNLLVTEVTNTAEAEKISSPLSRFIHATCFLRGLHITLTDDVPRTNSEKTEVILLSLDNVCVSFKPHVLSSNSEELNISVSVGDLQLDNQMYQRGGFDFPVILMGQIPKHHVGYGFSLSTPTSHLIEEVLADSLVSVNISVEVHNSTEHSNTTMKDLRISIGPLSTYIEDTLISKLIDYLKCLVPSSSVYLQFSLDSTGHPLRPTCVPVPREIMWNSVQLATPLRLRTFLIHPVSLLLTAHKSLKLYIALNHSPLQFPAFERRRLITTSYQLGQTLTKHYFFGAIFGAGWMLGSLELLGSPSGFARTLGTGLRDFVSLPYQGIFEGPWGFLVGVTHGSASLMKHATAGTLSSVTNLAASVARNLDILTLDEEHLARTEELRRQRPQGIAQGLERGLTGLGISLLGAVGGIAHHSLQSVMSEGPSTRGLVTGVGLGLVGAITKPLSGAAEFVALTGQGLLHGTGWTSTPEVRQQPIIEHAFSGSNSRLKYGWKLIAGLGAGRHVLLHVTEATCITPTGSYKPVALVLTTRALFLVDTEGDVMRRVLSLTELTGMDHPSDPTLLSFRLQTVVEPKAPSHARVVDFVRRSSGMVVDNAHDGGQSEADSSLSGSPVLSETADTSSAPLIFYVNPQSRNYFLSVLALAKRQSQGRGFPVL